MVVIKRELLKTYRLIKVGALLCSEAKTCLLIMESTLQLRGSSGQYTIDEIANRLGGKNDTKTRRKNNNLDAFYLCNLKQKLSKKIYHHKGLIDNYLHFSCIGGPLTHYRVYIPQVILFVDY